MIFVTVGTHEQGFERLLKKIDCLVEEGIVQDEVFIQSGYTEYAPKYCEYEKMLSSDDMNKYVQKSHIVITHGGPGSIMIPFSYGKIPIVVPRQHDFGEHVDNHQVKFTKKLEEMKKVIAIYDIDELSNVIENYDMYCQKLNCDYQNNTTKFVANFEKICNELVGIE